MGGGSDQCLDPEHQIEQRTFLRVEEEWSPKQGNSLFWRWGPGPFPTPLITVTIRPQEPSKARDKRAFKQDKLEQETSPRGSAGDYQRS